MHAKLLQSCPILCNPMNCSLPGSSVHEIFQAGILDWIDISYSKGSSRPNDETCISFTSCFGKQILYLCTTWKPSDEIELQFVFVFDIFYTTFLNVCFEKILFYKYYYIILVINNFIFFSGTFRNSIIWKLLYNWGVIL